MRCPQCASELVARRIQGIEVDVCANCGGVWLDAGELDAYRSAVGTIAGDPSVLSAAFHAAGSDERWPCPRCTTRSVAPGRVMDHGVHRCSACNGFYLSSTELQALSKSPARRYAEGTVNAIADGASYAPDAVLEVALDLLGGIFDGL